MTIGYLSGAFDLLNVQDLDLISQAGGQCDRLLIGIYTDEYAENTSGRRPVVPFCERFTLVAHLRGVDSVEVHVESLSSLPSTVRIFITEGQVRPEYSDCVVLTPRRQTQGLVLRRALAGYSRKEPAA